MILPRLSDFLCLLIFQTILTNPTRPLAGCQYIFSDYCGDVSETRKRVVLLIQVAYFGISAPPDLYRKMRYPYPFNIAGGVKGIACRILLGGGYAFSMSFKRFREHQMLFVNTKTHTLRKTLIVVTSLVRCSESFSFECLRDCSIISRLFG